MDLESNPDILLVRKHLVEHLGPPDEVFEVRGSPLPNSPIQALHLSYFAPGGPDAPVVFATCGASLFTMNDGRRVEAMMLFRRQPNQETIAAIHRLLSSFAIFAEANNEAVRIGDVVRAPDDLHRFCGMDAILFLPPVPFIESFHRIPLTQQKNAEIVWLLPVYESEANYALHHGPQALMMLFAAQGLDLTEMDRDEANTMIDPEDARALAQKRSEEERKKAESQPKQVQPTRRNVPPKKSNLGAGSFEVADQGDAVAIVRRGAKPKTKPPESAPPPPRLEVVPPPVDEPPPQQSSAPRAAPPSSAVRRKPLIAAKPQQSEVRFDIETGEQTKAKAPTPTTSPATAQRKPITPAAKPGAGGAAKPAPRPVPVAAKKPEPETPEQQAEAKRKRIEELKAKAQDAAKRAAERAGGGGGDDPNKA